MKTYKIPPRFYLDHLARDCGTTGKIVRSTKNYLIVQLDDIALDDLLGDARFYSSEDMRGAFDPSLTGLIASARATLRAIEKGE